MSPQKPGRRRDCPPWCEVDHGQPLDPVHRGVVAELHRGDIHVVITIQSDPRGPGPAVAIDSWDLPAGTSAGLSLPPASASELAAILAVLGLDDVAGYLRTAVDFLERPEP